MRCIITGCALITGQGWVAGDLFALGPDYYVFNGNARQGSVEYNQDPPHYGKCLEPTEWWERRGVFIIPRDEANLNQAALDYLKG